MGVHLFTAEKPFINLLSAHMLNMFDCSRCCNVIITLIYKLNVYSQQKDYKKIDNYLSQNFVCNMDIPTATNNLYEL